MSCSNLQPVAFRFFSDTPSRCRCYVGKFEEQFWGNTIAYSDYPALHEMNRRWFYRSSSCETVKNPLVQLGTAKVHRTLGTARCNSRNGVLGHGGEETATSVPAGAADAGTGSVDYPSDVSPGTRFFFNSLFGLQVRQT